MQSAHSSPNRSTKPRTKPQTTPHSWSHFLCHSFSYLTTTTYTRCYFTPQPLS